MAKLSKRRKSRHGFTIVEAVVATVLLSIALVPILKGLSGSHMIAGSLEDKTKCAIFAQARLDEIKARSIYYYDDSYGQTLTPWQDGLSYIVTDTAMGSDLRKITMTVGYDSGGGISGSDIVIEFSTLLARRI